MEAEATTSHRHDGTSPLPLGMDWIHPPKKWVGRRTKWPYDSCTGWSFFVMIPSWIIQPESVSSHGNFLKHVVFFRVEIWIRTPEGISSSHVIHRRFTDFLKLFSDIKCLFPKKNVPAAPPKHSLLRVNSSQLLLEERRHNLEEWMTTLFLDVDISRSAPVATFLELEAAVRTCSQIAASCVQNELSSEAVAMRSSPQNSSSASAFVSDDFDSEDAYEPSLLEPPREGKYIASKSGTEKMATTDGSYSRRTLDIPKSVLDIADDNLMDFFCQDMKSLVSHSDNMYGNSSDKPILSNHNVDSIVEKDLHVFHDHVHELSVGSCGSDIICYQVGKLAKHEISNSNEGYVSDHNVDSGTRDVLEANSGLPVPVLDDANPTKFNIVLSVQQRLLTAKTDMEDLIVQLYQEKHAKECLMSEVNNLEDELKASKQISKDNLQQAILTERGRITNFQWDNAEILSKILQIESKIKFEESARVRAESERVATTVEKELLLQELNSKIKCLENLQTCLEEMELKSREDLKVLVKEVKSLTRSQESIREVLNQCITENNKLKEEKLRIENVIRVSKKHLGAFGALRCRLEESSANFFAEDEEIFSVNSSSIPDALGLLKTSDNRISLLLAEAEHLAHEDKLQSSWFLKNHTVSIVDDLETENYEIRRLLSEIIKDNARLRRQMNSILRCALNAATQITRVDDKDSPARRKLLGWFSKK